MGARISIQFSNKNDKSPILCNHWGGEEFLDEVIDYLNELKDEAKEKGSLEPLYRLEPSIVMVDFIRHLTKNDKRTSSSLYLVSHECECDNSDYGHHEFELE